MKNICKRKIALPTAKQDTSLLSVGKRLQSECLISKAMTESSHENLDDWDDIVPQH